MSIQDILKEFKEKGTVTYYRDRALSHFDNASAKVKLHTQYVTPAYCVDFLGEKHGYKKLKNECKEIYEDIFLTNIFPTFALSRYETFQIIKLLYTPTAGGYLHELLKEVRASIFQKGQYLITTDSEKVNATLGISNNEKNNQNIYSLASGTKTNLIDFLQQVYLPFIAEEPNGLLAVIPFKDASGQIRSVKPILVPAENRITETAYYYENFLVYEANIQFQEVGTRAATVVYDRNTDVTEYFMFTGLAVVSGGISSGQKFKYFESLLNFVVPLANAYEESAVIKRFYDIYLRPEKVSYESLQCETCSGSGHTYHADNSKHDCKSCGGSGKKINTPMFGDIVIRDAVETAKVTGNSVYEFTAEVIQSLKYYADSAGDKKEEFLAAAFIKAIELAQSAIAKEKDRERLYKFVSDYSSVLFNAVQKHLSVMVLLLSDGTPNVIINRPTNTDLKTSYDRIKEYQDAATAGLNSSILVAKFLDSVRSTGNELEYKKALFLTYYDPYYCLTLNDKKGLDALGTVSKFDTFKTFNCYNVLSKLIIKNTELFFDNDYELISAQMDSELAALYQNSTQ